MLRAIPLGYNGKGKWKIWFSFLSVYSEAERGKNHAPFAPLPFCLCGQYSVYYDTSTSRRQATGSYSDFEFSGFRFGRHDISAKHLMLGSFVTDEHTKVLIYKITCSWFEIFCISSWNRPWACTWMAMLPVTTVTTGIKRALEVGERTV
jgi:hypothetical protein